MIRIFLGNIGSGKTASCVRELYHNTSNKTTFSNIITKDIENNKVISTDMIIKKIKIGEKRNGQVIYDLKLNVDFWKKVSKKYQGMNVIIDEAHAILNARRSGSKINIIMTNFMSLLRRVIGQNEGTYGTLTLISQLDNRVDIIAREMATQVRYHVCHYSKSCEKCKHTWTENNEMPEKATHCNKCGGFNIKKHSFYIEVWHFGNMRNYELWKFASRNTFYKHYYINDIQRYFTFYDTLQWENLLNDY